MKDIESKNVMSKDLQKDYPLVEELSEAALEENSSLKKMLHLVGYNKRVVDFGCATGYLARLLGDRGCEVVGVEVNAKAAEIAKQYCQEVIVADLDFVSITDILPKQSFDVAVFGDVLEHLRNPWGVLEEVKQILSPDGWLVASIPNVAHGAVRLALLQGKFKYESLGLLDSTHLRFFTRETVRELFERSGYLVEVADYTVAPIFSEASLVPRVNRNDFTDEVVQQIEQQEDAKVLQFILQAFPASVEGKLAALNKNYTALLQQQEESEIKGKYTQEVLKQAQVELNQLREQLEQSQTSRSLAQSQTMQSQEDLKQAHAQLHHLQAELQQSQLHLQHTYLSLSESQTQLQQAHLDDEDLRFQVKQLEVKLQRLRQKLQKSRATLRTAQSDIAAMETSKFWKLRIRWVKLKNLLKTGHKE